MPCCRPVLKLQATSPCHHEPPEALRRTAPRASISDGAVEALLAVSDGTLFTIPRRRPGRVSGSPGLNAQAINLSSPWLLGVLNDDMALSDWVALGKQPRGRYQVRNHCWDILLKVREPAPRTRFGSIGLPD